jgi:hypothetical protein
LLSQFARLDPTWGTINRLRRAEFDLPLSGAPDALRSIEPQAQLRSDGTTSAVGGDALAMFSTWTKDGRWQIESIVPFGSSNVAGTRHYADQAPLFADDGVLYAIGQLGFGGAQAAYVSTDGTTWTDRSAALPAFGNQSYPLPILAGFNQ